MSEHLQVPNIDLSGQVAIVTGAGGGLGREHALLLASRGAKVLVNDLGTTLDGGDRSIEAAERVTAEIRDTGGEAIANGGSVTDFATAEAMVAQALAVWGRVDILVNSAGVLRDRTFAKADLDDFRVVLDVHLMGSVNMAKAVWPAMAVPGYGRIVFTTSGAGLFGNIGQAAYGTAKMALVGLMQTLALEGARHDIRVNCIAPIAVTRMIDIPHLPADMRDAFQASAVSPGVLALVARDAPTRTILTAGAGTFGQANVTMTQGARIGTDSDAAERLMESWEKVADRDGDLVPASAAAQGTMALEAARR